MAQNPIPDNIDALIALATAAAAGVHQHGATIGIVQNTEARISADLDLLITRQAAFLQARAQKSSLTTAKNVEDSKTKAFIATTINVLQPILGNQWSSAWEELGFQQGSLALPRNMEERFGQLALIKAYLTNHPAHENAPLHITAAAVQALIALSAAARAASNDSNRVAGEAMAAREAAATAQRRRLRALIEELNGLIAADDPRWYAFGLNAPGDPETPGIPEHLVVTSGPAGAHLVYLDWDDARRADRYRVWLQKPGESAPTPLLSVTESDATLPGLPVGVSQLFVTAVNDAGESLPSAPSTVTIA